MGFRDTYSSFRSTSVTGSFIVGFAPVAPSAGIARPGFAAGEAGDGAGVFGALVDLLGLAAPDAGFQPAAEPGPDAASSMVATLPAQSSERVVTSPDLPEAGGTVRLEELIEALEALGETEQQPGDVLDPALVEELSGAIDMLAGLLGVTPPPVAPDAPPLVPGEPGEPITGEVAGGRGGDIPTPPVPAAGDAPPTTNGGTPAAAPAESAPRSASLPVAAAAPAAPAAAAPLGPTAAPPLPPPVTTATPQGEAAAESAAPPPLAPTIASPTAVPPLVDPASPLGRLLEKVTGLARALDMKAPGLAERLDALAQRLAAGELGTPLPAGRGPDRAGPPGVPQVDAVLARLFGATAPAAAEVPTPQAFTTTPLRAPPPDAPLPVSAAPAPAAPAAQGSADTDSRPVAASHPTPEQAPDREAAPDPAPATRTGAAEAKAAAPAADATAEPQAGRQAPLPPAVAATTLAASITGSEKVGPLAHQPPAQRISLPQVAFEVVRQVQAGNTRFQIRLDPPELGRIDVKLDVDQSGNVNARMTVERAETLDLMQRDHRALERALAQAGLDSARTSLEFSLRQNPFGRHDGGDGRGREAGLGASTGGDGPGTGENAPEGPRTLYRGSLRAGGVNLFV